MTDLTEIISYVQPTALLGLSTTKVRFAGCCIQLCLSANVAL